MKEFGLSQLKYRYKDWNRGYTKFWNFATRIRCGSFANNYYLCGFYHVLHGIKYRCTNPNHQYYKYYGGRGIGYLITVQDLVKLYFRDRAWRFVKPSIDREDNDGHYTLDNCQFMELSDNIKKSFIDRKNKKEVINHLQSEHQ